MYIINTNNFEVLNHTQIFIVYEVVGADFNLIIKIRRFAYNY